MELPRSIYKSMARYEPVAIDGMELKPVLVKEFEEFTMARPALEVLHQSLPVRFLRTPLLAALYQIDYEATLSGQPSTGLFSRALLGLALSLRLGEGAEPEARIRQFGVIVGRESPEKLIRLQFTDNDGKEKEITPASYPMLRQIIAEQNGVELESDTANPQIVAAQKKLAEVGNVDLQYSLEDMISAVALASNTDESEIYEWAILKLNRRAESLSRMLTYIVCGIGEASGASWKGGNPVPHPFFKRAKNGNGLLNPLGANSSGEQDKNVPQSAKELAAKLQTINPQQ